MGVIMKRFLKFLVALSILFLVFICNSTKAKADTFYEDNENGIITITYNNKNNAKMKVVVTKDSMNYYYDMEDGKNNLDIPLNMGNGTYKIRICINTTASKYSIIASETIELNLSDEDEVFTYSNVIINYKDADNVIKKAAELTKGCKSDTDKVKKIYNYILKNFSYDKEKAESVTSGYVPDIRVVYKNKKGICYDLSAIMAAMLRSQGIKVKLLTGFTTNIDVYHAWNAVYDTKTEKWYTIDTTYDVAMKNSGRTYKMKKDTDDYTDIKYQY